MQTAIMVNALVLLNIPKEMVIKAVDLNAFQIMIVLEIRLVFELNV